MAPTMVPPTTINTDWFEAEVVDQCRIASSRSLIDSGPSSTHAEPCPCAGAVAQTVGVRLQDPRVHHAGRAVLLLLYEHSPAVTEQLY